jgi:hypothetical protein
MPRTLMRDLDRRGIRTKRRAATNGRTTGGIRFGVGPLAHLLQNRFYITVTGLARGLAYSWAKQENSCEKPAISAEITAAAWP